MTQDKDLIICLELIKLEIKSRKEEKYTKNRFFEEMQEQKINNEFFCQNTRTLERYLNNSKDSGKRFKDFIRLSIQVLGFLECEMLEMIEIYKEICSSMELETVTMEMYKNCIRPQALVFRQIMYRYTKLPNRLKEDNRNLALVKELDHLIKKSFVASRMSDIIALYNVLNDVSPRMLYFWQRCMAEMYCENIAYISAVDKKISNIKVNLNTTKDYRLLLKIKSDIMKECNHLSLEEYKKNPEKVNGKILLCAVVYYQLKDKDRELFLEIAIKYTFLKKTKGIL